MVHAERQLPEDVLLGVLRPDGREQGLEAGDVAARSRGADAVVQRHQVGGLRAAAAVARAADALGIDLRAGLQVVDGPHAVPDLEAGGVAAQQDAADAEHRVGGRALDLRQRGGHLAALALVDRVEDESRHAVEGQECPHRLVRLIGLGLAGVAAGHDDAGEWEACMFCRHRAGTAEP